MKLTGKQSKFVKAYILNNGNATQAAITAGYSNKTAQTIGSENLCKPIIMEAIAEHRQRGEDEFIMSKNDKLKLLQKAMDFCGLKDEEKGMLNGAVVMSAIKEHNLMMGHNAPTEIIQDTSVSEIVLKVIC